MKRLAALLTLTPALLTACPAVQGAAQGTASRVDLTPTSATFVNADPAPALKVVLVLDGVQSSDPRCLRTSDGVLDCRLGDVNGNSSAQAVQFTGQISSGSATWRTPAGKLVLLILK